MKIRIKENVSVSENIRPTLDGIYEVIEEEKRKGRGRTVYFVKVGNERVGVLARECEIIRGMNRDTFNNCKSQRAPPVAHPHQDYAAYTAAAAAAKLEQDAFNLSMSLCPILAVTAAAGTLIAVVRSWLVSMTEASEQVKAFTESLEESKTAYEDLTAAVEEEQASTAASLAVLENLLAVEKKSATQTVLETSKNPGFPSWVAPFRAVLFHNPSSFHLVL